MGFMNIIDHGEWVACDKPENYPVKLPSHILFSRRVSDGVDWYQFQRKHLTAPDTLKVTAFKSDEGHLVVLTTTYDQTSLFPTGGMRLLEVVDPPRDHEALRMQRIDLNQNKFSPPPPPPLMSPVLKVIIEELGLDVAKIQDRIDSLNKGSHHG
jgi:hypothetical protein